MKPQLKRFDTALVRVISKLPDYLSEPFDILGYIFAPPAWMLYVTVFALLSQQYIALFIVLLLPLTGVIKYVFRRQRPPTIYAGGMRIKSYSFPSSHAYAAALAGGYLACITLPHHTWFSVLVYLLVVVMGVSRVKLGAHYPSDVIAGLVLGLAIASLVAMT